MPKYKNLLVDVQGGLGLNINFANLVPELLEKYEHVSVISPYADVFQSLQEDNFVVYPTNQANVWKSALEDAGEDTLIVTGRIYDSNDFIRKLVTYHDAWRVKCGLDKLDEEKLSHVEKSALHPEVAFPGLLSQVQQIQEDLKAKGYKNFILMQHTGGQSPLVQVPAGKDGKPDWSRVAYKGQQAGLSRHYPEGKAAAFVKKFREDHPETAVVSYTLPNEPYVEGTERYVVPYLAYHILARQPNCKGAVCIDSSLQHLLAGLDIPVVVIWGHSDSHSFGYDNYKNIEQPCKKDNIHYFSALGPAHNRIEYISPEALYQAVSEVIKYE